MLNDSKKAEAQSQKKRNGWELVCEKRLSIGLRWQGEGKGEKSQHQQRKGRAKEKGNTRNKINGTNTNASGTVAMSSVRD